MRLYGLFGVVLLAGAAVAQTTAKPQPISVSMIQLISTPEKFDGKFVRVEGWIRLELEEYALYFTRDDEQHLNAADALWVESIRGIKGSREELDGRYVVLEGIFQQVKQVQSSGRVLGPPPYPGRMTSVSRIDAIPGRSEIQKNSEPEASRK